MLMCVYELEQNQLKEVNKNDYLGKSIHIDNLIATIKKRNFAKDCKDICEPKAFYSKRTMDLMR
jgi:hypothetical protein